jgi:hypothetical protein
LWSFIDKKQNVGYFLAEISEDHPELSGAMNDFVRSKEYLLEVL